MNKLYKNIYHMLAYAFQVLNENGYKQIALEDFENTADLLSAILCRGVSIQIKRGLIHTYISEQDALSSPKGKIEVSESIKTQSLYKKQLVCSYDDYTANSYFNQILKTTLRILLQSDVSKERKKEIKKLLLYFDGIDLLNPYKIDWHQRYDRNNQTYKMLHSLCYMVIKGLLQTSIDGTTKLMDFIDEQRMCHLYEKFILKYFCRHYPELNASASQIPWVLDIETNTTMLPVMQSDITLTHHNKVLIIDAKYYSHTTQIQFGKNTLHSKNLYQIFTYVKNKDAQLDASCEVSGMLLYARTKDEIQPNNTFLMSGNKITVTTLDLNCDFSEISKQLNAIADSLLL